MLQSLFIVCYRCKKCLIFQCYCIDFSCMIILIYFYLNTIYLCCFDFLFQIVNVTSKAVLSKCASKRLYKNINNVILKNLTFKLFIFVLTKREQTYQLYYCLCVVIEWIFSRCHLKLIEYDSAITLITLNFASHFHIDLFVRSRVVRNIFTSVIIMLYRLHYFMHLIKI